MLWCFPQFPFHFPITRLGKKRQTSPAPSSPAEGETEMHHNYRYPQQYHEHQKTHDHDANSESGVFYLVPNKHGPGKSIVRRPRAPLTSTPLDDDFDAYTQGGTTTRTRTHKEEYQWEQPRTSPRRRRGQDSDVTVSSSPLKSDFNPVTNQYAGVTPVQNSRSITKVRDHDSALQHGSWDKVRPRRSRPADGTGGGSAAYGIGRDNSRNRPGDGFDGYGEYGQYMDEMEQMFGHGGGGEVKLSLTQLGHGLERTESRQNDNGSGKPVGSRSSAALIKVGTGQIGRPSRLGSVGRSGDGPKAGQDYEMINRRVVEDGPEKTVTISTWREQVANETRTIREGELDVYYVGAEDYADGSGVQGHGARMELDNHVNGRRAVTPSKRQGSGSGGPSSSGGKTNEGGRRPSTEVHASWRKTPGQAYHSQPRSEEMTRNQKILPNRSNSPRSQSWKQASPPRTPTPNREDSISTQSRGTPLRESMDGLEGTPPRSSTPIRRLPQSSSPKISTPPRASTPYRALTPRDRELPPEPEPELEPEPEPDPEPFHPTQSGSTISTIKSSSMVAFENVLASCEPSLLHISPVLAKLGIVTEGHLRAVARLTEETRDREVKDEALRQGVTVMEWAILLDRLQAL